MDAMWQSIFSPQVSILEKLIRTILVYAFLIIGLRLAGKRELGQLNTFDLVVLLLLSNTVQNAIIGPDNSALGGIIGGAMLLAVNWFTVRFLYRHNRLDRVIEGTSVILIDKGQIIRRNLDRQAITEDELIAACRRQGIENITDVQTAILETSGAISIFTRHPTAREEFTADLAAQLDRIEQELGEIRRELAPHAHR